MKTKHLQCLSEPKSSDGTTWLAELNDAIEQLCAYRCSLIEEHERLSRQLSQMQKQPHYENARIWLRKGQYAYLHLSFRGGKRSRTYIGTNVQKIAAVEEAIAYGRRITQLRGLIDSIEERARHEARRFRL